MSIILSKKFNSKKVLSLNNSAFFENPIEKN